MIDLLTPLFFVLVANIGLFGFITVIWDHSNLLNIAIKMTFGAATLANFAYVLKFLMPYL